MEKSIHNLHSPVTETNPDTGKTKHVEQLLGTAKKRHRILVVDDELRIVELLRRELGRIYKVFTATGGPEALEVVDSEDISLVVADQRMPGMSGTELLTKVVERNPNTVRILLTGYTDLNALVGAINDGQVYRYVSKPWEPEELKIVIKQGIEKYELEHQNRILLQDLRKKNVELFQALEGLRKAQMELLRTERLSTIGKMANMIIHDFKNPLTSVMGLSDLLISMPMLDEGKRFTYYRMIHDESQRILQMVLEILEYVRGEGPTLSRERLGLGTFMDEFRQEVEIYLNGSNIELTVDAGCQDIVILDRKQFKRALHNLVANGREAMPEGGRLTLNAGVAQDRIFIRISDTGTGIPREDRPNIFEPFFTKGKETGSGMGLVIVKRILEAHNGEIELESSNEKGTTFCIRLPREDASGQAVIAESSELRDSKP